MKYTQLGPVCRICWHEGILIAQFENPPVNAISAAVREAIVAVVEESASRECRALVFCAKGRGFFSGADIREFNQPQERDLPATLAVVDSCQAPILCLLHGSVLGGGLEVALRCDYRLAHHQARFGFPEVNLGLIPGAGGTQLLPRLLSADAAAEMLCGGKPIDAAAAQACGLIDGMLPSDLDDGEAWLAWAIGQIEDGGIALAKNRLRDKDVVDWDDGALEAYRIKMEKRARGQQSPLRAFEALEAALRGGIDDGLAREREIFLGCKSSDQSVALRHIFFAEKESSKLGLDPDQGGGALANCAVVGCGTMGAGIGAALLQTASRIVLIDASADTLERARNTVLSRLEKMRARRQLSPERCQDAEGNLVTTDDFGALADADLVIEAVFEDLSVKQEVIAKIAERASAEAILATNTSYIDPNRIFDGVPGLHRCLGLHFFSPADVMKLLEVVRLDQTDAATMAAAAALAKGLRKIAVLAKPGFGFIANRSYMAYGRAVQELLLAGNAPEQIDKAMTGFGMALGPLAVLDMSGIDIGHNGRKHNPEPPKDPGFYLPAATLFERGELGRKSGVGFYRYQEDGRACGHNEAALAVFAEKARELGIEQTPRSGEQIVSHVMATLVEECQRLVDSGVCSRPSDMDVVWVNGYGFPRWRGGPMHWQGAQG